MITVEIRDAEKASAGMAEVEIFCDAEGLALLFKQLRGQAMNWVKGHLEKEPN